MSEDPSPYSAVAQHFEYEVEVAALARQYYEEEGRPEGRSLDHWLRAEREIRRRMGISKAPDSVPDSQHPEVEEAMHLDQ
jgi:hypothetical protein